MSQSPPPALRIFLQALALVAITFLIYLPSLHGGKILDDEIMFNALVQSPAGLFYIWCKAMTPDYFPLTFSSLWLEYRFWGDNMFGYHVTNVLLHAISAILLWRVLRALKVPGAWLAAMLFAVHPVNVESVAWISQRKNALAMPFFLATILFYLKSKARNGNIKYYMLSLVSFALALLSKTAVVPLPFVLLLVDWWQGRTREHVSGEGPAGASAYRQHLVRIGPYFALSFIFGLITLWFQKHRVIGIEEVQTSSMAARLATAGWGLWFYIYKTFIPFNLVFVYPRWDIAPDHILTWLPLVAFMVVAVAIWRWRERLRGVVLAFGYFVLMLLPVLGFVSIYYQKYSLVADHWQYFAIIGPIALASAALVSIARVQAVINCIAIAVIGGFAFLAWQQSHLYQSAEIIWRDTIARNPTCWLAHNSYGLEVMQRAMRSSPSDKPLLEEAIEHYKESLRLRPDNVEARVNTGSALIALGRVDEGKAEFKQAQQTPNDALGYYNLGFILHQEHMFAEAEAEYRKAIKVWPQYTLAYLWLGRVLAQESKFAEAEEAYSQAMKFLPVSVPAHRELAHVLESQNKFPRAEAEYRSALELEPKDPAVHYHLANMLLKLNKANEAAVHYSKAIELQPNYAEPHYQLAVYLSSRGQVREALAHYQQAVRLKSNWITALNNAAWLLATAKDDSVRSGVDAVALASRAVMLTQTNSADALDTLSAAYAETGRFDEAVKTAEQGIRIADAAGAKEVQAGIQQHRQLYLAKKPVRD